MSVKLPIGKDIFSAVREGSFYYIDKTELLKKLLSREFGATLITRPRRFGKTLTMSMLEDFFDISRDSREHFRGLKISGETEICREWMNQWPVIFVTLKSVEGLDFEGAYSALEYLIAGLCRKYAFLEQSEAVDPADKEAFVSLKFRRAAKQDVKNSLDIFIRMLTAHYGKPTILLIDEYDVPLAKAYDGGYYKEMLDIIRTLLSVIKTNDNLKFAVLTGCLRIAKESIFTGTNNFVIDTIMDNRFNEYIGFTETDVKKLLDDTDFTEHLEEIKNWYDGYSFGKVEVYCPWDVLSHVEALTNDKEAVPLSYWENTSHNDILKIFLNRKDLWKRDHINEDIETLLKGGVIEKQITTNLTYDVLHSTAENIWSLLYFTGYLTQASHLTVEKRQEQYDTAMWKIKLRIPNEEMKYLFHKTVKDWFDKEMRTADREELFEALWKREAEICERKLSETLLHTISYHDYHESFYHAFLVGVLSYTGYKVESNHEEGDGRPDIVVKDELNIRAIVIEVKQTKTLKGLNTGCEAALQQIRDKNYTKALEDEYEEIICYGICFFKKRCKVMVEKYKAQ